MASRFECETRVDAPIEAVFDLALTIDSHEASMARFNERAIGGVTSGQIDLGQEVTWRARHFGIHWTMTSRIVELERPTYFVDHQVRGPFSKFRHEHRFSAEDGATRMGDVVTFEAPLGPLGALAEVVFLRTYVQRLIDRRNRYLKQAAERAPRDR
jgi:ligand-binding SRPBCC domain-containing protein